MKIDCFIFVLCLICAACFVVQETESKDTSDYYSNAGFGLAILQLPFALPFYAVQSITTRTGIWIRESFRRMIKRGKRPAKSQANSTDDLTSSTATKFSQDDTESERF